MLQFVALASIIVAITTTVIFAHVTNAAPGTNKTISFQGRLLTSGGAVVPDGRYNIQFKIYQDGTGEAAGNPNGTLKWTESYVNNNAGTGVQVKNGYFSVGLGSVTPFGTSVDWNQDTLWLSMNIAGTAATCTTFGTAPCAADGEMLPMKQMTATPYAMNAGALGGKTAENFLQLAQGVQTDASNNTSSIHVNKTGTGNLVQLQNSGSDVFSVTNSGNIEFGNSSNHAIYVGTAAENTAGKNLTIFAGYGGSGSGSMGGELFLQGGSAGGENGEGGSVSITGGAGTGTGKDGSIYIGATDTDTIQIGSPSQTSGSQTINIGNNSGAGNTNIVIGSTGEAGGGSTKIQSKDNTTISTDGVDRATFDTNGNLILGNGATSNTPADFRIQGTASSADGVSGANLTVQGGGATTGNTNGGNLNLMGGEGSGTGVAGLVVMNTPTYLTAGVQSSAVNTTVTQSNIDSFGVVSLNATAPNVAFTLGAPTLGANATGRLLYVSAANGSQNFTLRANVGAGAGAEQNILVKQNTATTMLWTGSLWIAAGGSGQATLQGTYDNTVQSTGDAQLVVNNPSSSGGLSIRDGGANTLAGPLLEVQDSSASSLFSINSNVNQLATNPGAENAGTSATTFPTDTWGVAGTSTISRYTTPGSNIESGKASVRAVTNGAYSGTFNRLSTALTPGQSYAVSFSARLESGSVNDFGVFYLGDGNSITATCTDNVTVTSTDWTKVTCSFTAPASGITVDNIIAIGHVGAGAHTFYVDNMSVTFANETGGHQDATANIKVGDDTGNNSATLFTLDKSATAPTAANGAALLGSMYYDTTLGKVQCYESEGWGACGASPDTFVTLSPEYSNAVMHGSGTGTMSSDLCSDDLNINDGSASQPTICGTNETFNFYKWTSAETADQTRSIFVTYQLPSSFKEFVPGTTSLMGRTDSNDSKVEYQVYRNNSDGLTACGSVVSVSNGVKTTWQKATATNSADPANCDFDAGDNIVIRINATSKDDAKAYISNLGFTFSNQ